MFLGTVRDGLGGGSRFVCESIQHAMATLSCGEFSEMLGDYVDRRLSESERRAFDAHAAACMKCAELLRSYRELPGVLRRGTDVVVPQRLEARLRRWLPFWRRKRE